jgi:hypothetical protein
MADIIEMLNKKSKTELVELIEELITDGDLLVENLTKHIKVIEMTEYEITIIEKLKTNLSLLLEEKEYITQCLNKRTNTKISTIFSGNKKFDAFLVGYKLNKYFDMLWKNYPKRTAKETAKKAFNKFIKDFKYGVVDKIIIELDERIKKYAQQCEELGTDDKYILMFSTYLNQKRFND